MNSHKDIDDSIQDHQEDQKRTRARQACETCRKKKTKCSGEIPVCNNCALQGLECHYLTVEKRRGPQKGYVRALESRLDNLQNLLEVYVDKISLSVRNQDGNLIGDGTGEIGNESDDYQAVGQANSIPSSPIDMSRQKVDQSTSDNNMALVSKSQVPQTRNHFQPFTTTNRTQNDTPGSTLTTPKVIGHVTLLEDSNTVYMGESSGAYFLRGVEGGTTLRIPSINNPLAHQNHLPSDYVISEDIRNILLQIYFTCFHPYWPILHKSFFISEFNQPNHGNIPDYLLDAMCSLASNLSQEALKNPIPNIDFISIGMLCHSRCLSKINSMIEHPNIYSCQTMLILACCSTGKGLTNSWMYRGIAINMAFELGLHRDLDIPCDNSNIQLKYLKNVHQRIWWNCYVLDRMISVISGRPTSIDEEEFDTSFPSQSDGPENFPHVVELHSQPLDDEISLKFFIKFIELSQLYGKVSRNIYSVRSRQGYSALKLQSNIHHLGESLNAWYMSFLKLCPDSLNSSSPLYTFGVLQRIYYHTLTVLLYRPLLPRPKQPMTTFAKTYYENSINSALKLVELIHQNQSLFMASGSNFKLYPIIVAITILTLGASSSESDSQVKDNCREGAITTLKLLGAIYTQIPLTCHAILSSIQMLSSNGIINEHNVEADWPSGLVTAFNLYHSLKSSFIDLNKDQLNKPQTSAYQEASQANQDHLAVGNQNITSISSDSPSIHTGSHSTPINSHSNPQTAQPEPYQLPPSNEQASLKRDISAVESSSTPIPAAAHMSANNANQSPTNPTSRDISQSLLHNLQQTRNVRPMFHPSNNSANYTQPHPGMVDSPMFQHTMQQQSNSSAPNFSNFSSNNLAASATFSQPNVMNSINPHQQAMEHPLWRMRNPGMTSVPNNQSVSPSAPQARPSDMPTSFPQVHPSMANRPPMMGGPGMMNHLGLNNPNNMLQNYTLPPQLLNIHNQIRQQNYNQQGQLNNPNTLSLMDLGWNMDPSYQFNYPFNANGNSNNNSNNENTSQNS